MEPFIEDIILAVVVSAVIAFIFYIFYLMVVKGFEPPLRLFNRFKSRYRSSSRNKRVKKKLYEYEAITGMHEPSLLASAIVLCLFVVIVFLLLFNVVFFVAVTSGSMRPTFERGDLVLMQQIDTKPVEGDIILLERKDIQLPITHRVASVTEDGIRTKGDARGRVDPWVLNEEEIMAKAVQLGNQPVVLKDIGDYFILDTSEMRVGKFGTEYAFMKNLFLTIKMYGYVLCILAILGYVILTIREHK